MVLSQDGVEDEFEKDEKKVRHLLMIRETPVKRKVTVGTPCTAEMDTGESKLDN